VGDLLRWEQNFANPPVGDRAPLDAMQTAAMPTGWEEGSAYGFGVEIAKHRGLRTVGHGGDDRVRSGASAYFRARGASASPGQDLTLSRWRLESVPYAHAHFRASFSSREESGARKKRKAGKTMISRGT
jgi:hypothetical protein